jgi:hypothetical protein
MIERNVTVTVPFAVQQGLFHEAETGCQYEGFQVYQIFATRHGLIALFRKTAHVSIGLDIIFEVS